MKKVTIFTPSYNRGEFLGEIYKCLCQQTCKDFEWIIVDDGSTDNTSEIVRSFISGEDNSFPIYYYYKQNGGKHTAINLGVKKAIGELFLILDSDDSLPQNSIQTILDEYKSVSTDEAICGVCGLMSHHDGTLVSSCYPQNNLIANSIELRYKYKLKGDLIEIFKTSVLKEFPFPEIHNERFCPEALVWNRIACKYKLMCFNKIVYYRDYLEGGLTDNIVKIRMKSPFASMMCYSEMNRLQIPVQSKLKAAINYWRFRFCCKSNVDVPKIGVGWIWVVPIAYFMHIRDCRVLK